MVAGAQIRARSVLTRAEGLAETPVLGTFVYVCKGNHTWRSGYLYKFKHHLSCKQIDFVRFVLKISTAIFGAMPQLMWQYKNNKLCINKRDDAKQ